MFREPWAPYILAPSARGLGAAPPTDFSPAHMCRVPFLRGSIGGSAPYPASAGMGNPGATHRPHRRATPRGHTLQPLPRRLRVPPAPARGSWGTADKSPSLYPPGTAMPGAVSAGVDRGQRPLSGFRPEGNFRAPPTALILGRASRTHPPASDNTTASAAGTREGVWGDGGQVPQPLPARPAHRQQRQRRLMGRRDDLAHFPLSLPPIPWYTPLVSPLGVPALLAERSIARCFNPSNLIRVVPA